MTDIARCPECGSPLPPDAPQGLCPRCLMTRALDGSADSSTVIAPFDPHAAPTVVADFDPNRADSRVSLFRGLVESSLAPGQQFGAYRIQRLLGKGGMGEVYETFHAPSGRWVAIKLLNQALGSEDDRKRFIREGRLAASVSHPNCVYVFGTEEIEGIPVIVMELAPSGTVNQLVKRTGPPSVERSVEMANQIIAGLEAAQAAGVLHRDIKPSNCFLSSQGEVKIGDFGLSITTLAKDQSQLTLTGSFIGTPVFASPEQLRGDKLDVRSDIYSLGVTLYYILTGTVPFEAENLVQLVATVLEKAPPSPSTVRPEIPKALSQVILRCLEKAPEKRFASYEALRKALSPFCPGVPVPAAPARRFIAACIDNIAMTMLIFYPLVGFRGVATGTAFTEFSQSAMNDALFLEISTVQIAFTALTILYYAVAEGLWGATPGKAIMRLRVVNAGNRAPGLRWGLLRATVYVLPPILATQIAMLIYSVNHAKVQPGMGPAMLIWLISMLVYVLLFSTMRARNGFAAVHDLASKTRVVANPSFASERLTIVAEVTLPEPNIFAAVGPYGAVSAVPEDDSEHLVLGYDALLRRSVWLHLLPKGTPPTTPQRRDVSRQGRLRWINGLRTPDACWDAYEAPDGKPFLDLLDAPQPWRFVRRWTLDLAEELAAAIHDQSLPPHIGLDRVWITAQGRAKLLDFPPIEHSSSHQAWLFVASSEFGLAQMQQFLHHFIRVALRGNHDAAHDKIETMGRSGLPVHAVELMNKLERDAFDDAPSLVGALKRTIGLPTDVTWRRRLASMSALVILPTLWTLGVLAASVFYILPNFRAVENRPDLMQVTAAAQKLESNAVGASGPPNDPAVVEQRKALEIYIAGHFRSTVTDPALRENMFSGLYEGSSTRKRADQALADYPSPTEQEIAAATEAVAPQIDEWVKLYKKPELGGMLVYFMFGFMAVQLLLFGIIVPFFAVSAFATRGGVLLRAAGIAVVSRNGQPVSRLRALWRSLITWSAGWLIVIGFCVRGMSINGGKDMEIAFALFIIFVLGAIYSLFARRSIQDRIAGTYLVPL